MFLKKLAQHTRVIQHKKTASSKAQESKILKFQLHTGPTVNVSKTPKRDTIHFSGDSDNRTSTSGNSNTGSSRWSGIARPGQSSLFTAANDGHRDTFLELLKETDQNPNETVKGDTNTLQVLIGNYAYYNNQVKRFTKEAKASQDMLEAFLKHEHFDPLTGINKSLVKITNQILELENKELLEALLANPRFDIKTLGSTQQDKIWIALGIGELRSK